jgi:transposase
MSQSNQEDDLTLISCALGGLPIINHVLDRLGLPALLAGVLPAGDARQKLAPAAAIRVVVTNLVLGREPLYGLGEWAARYDPGLLGLTESEVDGLNDDRVGRALDALFDADRASLLTAVVLRAVSEFAVDTSQLHNDSTSISVHGAYWGAVGTVRGGKPTAAITFGHSKDHRPDLKQLVWILTVAADGAVPLAYRLADGNTSDDPTHIPTWDGLVALLGRGDFLYVADSKLCSRAAMGHIAGSGGRFITVLPRSRAEDGVFREWLQTHTPDWTQAARRGGRAGEPEQVYSTTPAPLPSAEGYRITWVHSTAKAARDGATRSDRIQAGIAAVEALDAKLAGPRSRYKTRVAVEHAASAALAQAHADRWVTATVTATTAKTYKQARRGRPGPETSYREITTNRFALAADIDLDHVAHDAASDGCFPLITNDRNLSDAQVLAAYRYQPNLERRHHLLKSVQDAAPVLLKNPARIEALFCCQFLALLVAALIERQVRTAMAAAALDNIPLYPEFRDCTAPSTERILEIFTNLARHQLHHDGVLVKTFEPELSTQQQQVLDLLGLAPTAYTRHRQLPR